MRYGINGNTAKADIWQPVNAFIEVLRRKELPFCMSEALAQGLTDRGLQVVDACVRAEIGELAAESDLILSFGGDGTMLRSAHAVGRSGTPILGVNIGRLGFLADIDVGQLEATIDRLEAGDYRVEHRSVLDVDLSAFGETEHRAALNEFVIERGGSASMIAIDVRVDGRFLNTYWADGLIIATATGSTAYSLSVGGPIISPGAGVIVVTPIAPHMLTVRPIVLPIQSHLEVHVRSSGAAYVVAADGRSRVLHDQDKPILIGEADYVVNLVKLPEQDYFETLRNKLMWGQGRVRL